MATTTTAVLPQATAYGVETGSNGMGLMGPLGDGEGKWPMKGWWQTEQDNRNEDDGTNNARDDTSSGRDRTNEEMRGQQGWGQGGSNSRGSNSRDSNGNGEDNGPSTHLCHCEQLLTGWKVSANGWQWWGGLPYPAWTMMTTWCCCCHQLLYSKEPTFVGLPRCRTCYMTGDGGLICTHLTHGSSWHGKAKK